MIFLTLDNQKNILSKERPTNNDFIKSQDSMTDVQFNKCLKQYK